MRQKKEWPYLPGLAPVLVLSDHASKAIWSLVKRNHGDEIQDDEATVDLYVLAPRPGDWGENCTVLRVATYRQPGPARPDGGRWLGDVVGHGPGPSWACVGCCFTSASAPGPGLLRFGHPSGPATEFRVLSHFHTSSRSACKQKAKKDLHRAARGL